MKKNYLFSFLAAFLVPFMTIAAQGIGENPEYKNEIQPDCSFQKVSKAVPNEDKNKGLLMYVTSLNDSWKERGWYEIRANIPFDMTKIKTWDPGSGSYIDGLGCGSWGGDAYYAYRVLLYDAGTDYPDSFVKVDVKTGNLTVVKQFSPSDELRRNWKKYDFYYMTYNPKKDVIYAYGKTLVSDSRSVTSLYEVDKTNGGFKKIKDFDFISMAMAVDYNGNLWVQVPELDGSVKIGDWLCLMDTEDDFKITKTIELYNDGIRFISANYYGTMSFDYTTGELYWFTANNTFTNSQNLYLVDLETGSLKYKRVVYGAMIGMYIPYLVADSPAAPAVVGNLQAVSDENGELRSTLTWVNPSKQWNGETLTDLSGIKIYRKGESNPTVTLPVDMTEIGKNMSWTDDNAVAGINAYFVVPYNKSGNGIKDSIEVLVGDDIPAKVKNIVINNEKTSVTLSWEPDTKGANDGYVNTDNFEYTVVRYPDNKVIAERVKEETVTDSDFAGEACYYYSIQAFNKTGEGEIAESERFVAGEAHEVPVVFDFTQEIYSGAWTNLGSWTWISGVQNGDERMISELSGSTELTDNWLVSPDIKLEAGKKYRIKSVIKTDLGPSGSGRSYYFKFAMGQGKTVDAMNNNILRNEKEHKVSEYYYVETFVDYLEVEETGNYNYGVEVTKITNGDTFSFMELTVEEIHDIDLAAVELKNVVDAIYNKDNICSVVIFNNGDKAVSDYTVKIARVGANGEYVVLGETSECPEIAPEASVEVTLTFKPNEEVDMNIVGLVEASGDSNTENDATNSYPLVVLPEDFVEFNRTITDESALRVDTRIPISFCSAETMTQTVYLEEELNVSENSRIQRIAYQYDGNEITSVLGPVIVKIYMCNTDKEFYASEKDAIPVEQMNLVYEGEVDVNPGTDNSMTFILDEEFVYEKGKNLCVAFTKSGSLGNDYPALFKVFNEQSDNSRTIVSDIILTNYWKLPVIKLALIEDEPGVVGIEKNITVGPKIWFDKLNSTLNFIGNQVKNVTVYDMSGKVIGHFDVADGIDSMKMEFPAGVYVVRTVDVEGLVANIKVAVVK